MGIRANAWLSHDLSHFDDATATLRRLNLSLPAGVALCAFWHQQHTDEGLPTWKLQTWEALTIDPRSPNQRSYSGPGLLWVDITPSLARIRTAARWQGFLTLPELRQRHVEAFIAIADGLNSPKIAICAESDEGSDLLLGGANQQQCIDHLRARLGDPRPGYVGIRKNIGVAAATKIWVLEEV